MKMYTTPPKFSQIPQFIREDVPVYRLRESIYVDDTLMEAGSTVETSIEYVPNEHMFPVNQLAYDNYVKFLTENDKELEKFKKIARKDLGGYMITQPLLPRFLREWEKVNQIAKSKRLHLCKAIDLAPAILGAPRTEAPKVTKVEMSNMPMMTDVDVPVIGKGNTADKDMSSASAVRNSLPAA